MKQYIKDYILEQLDDNQGRTVYACDLASELYNNDNMTGSIDCNRYESEQFLTEHKDEFVNIIKYWKIHGGADFSNQLAIDYFENPEKAHCNLVFTYVDAVVNLIMAKEYQGRDIWDEQIELDDAMIGWIKENLDDAIDAGFDDMDAYNE